MTMIERVARALWDAQSTKPGSWDLLHPSKQDGMRDRACAAIEALRVPTEAMLRAGGVAWHKADPHDAAALVWGRMIEAALADVKPPSRHQFWSVARLGYRTSSKQCIECGVWDDDDNLPTFCSPRTTRVPIDPKTVVDRNVLPPLPDDPVVDALPASRSWPVPDDFWP